jgi:hypothetical protein
MTINLCMLAVLAGTSAASWENLRFTPETETLKPTSTRPYTVHRTSYRSQALPLADGQVVYTDPQTTPLVFPSADQGSYAILSFISDIGDENNRSIPLDEVAFKRA